MLAKHIVLAMEEGVEAGLEAYLKAPSSKMYPAYHKIAAKRTEATKLKAYCAIFRLSNDSNGVIKEKTEDDIQKIVEEVAKLMGKVSEPVIKSAKNKNTKIASITAGEAWVALGSGPDFEPSDKDRPANNGQLYRLNTLGLLSLK